MSIAAWLYPVIGMAGLGVAALADGQRGATGALAAWIVCAVPLLFDSLRRKVAKRAGIDKTTSTQGLTILPPGMLFRTSFVLCGAMLLYHQARDRLGNGFWFAVVVFYQAALAVVVLRSRRRSGAGAGST